MQLRLVRANSGESFSIPLFPVGQTVITYLEEPSRERFNQYPLETTDGSVFCEEIEPFTIISNTIMILGVPRLLGEGFRNFIKDTLSFDEQPFTLSILRGLGEEWLDDMNLGLGFQHEPSVGFCNLTETSDDGLFLFREPNLYDIKIPYSFKLV